MPLEGPYINVHGERSKTDIPTDTERMLAGWWSSQIHRAPTGSGNVPMVSSVPVIGQDPDRGVEISRSFEGVLTSVKAVMREAEETAKRVALYAEQTAKSMGAAAGSTKDAASVQQAAVNDIAQKLQQIPGQLTLPGMAVAPGPFQASPAATGNVPPITRGGDPGEWLGYREGQGFSMASIRQDVLRSASRRIGDLQGRGPQLSQDDTGNWRTPSGDVADESEVATFLRRQRTWGTAANVIGGIAERKPVSEALLGALPSGAAKVAGGVGAAVTAVGAGLRFAENQRRAGAVYQRELGGTAIEALGERGRANLFGLTQLGTMGSDEAVRLYQGTLGIFGADQTNRQTANEFAANAYREFGMTIDQSLRLIRISAGEGNEALGSLAATMREVSQAARDAGVSANALRQSFVANYEAAAQIASGQGSIAVAQQMTLAQAQLGRRFGDVDLSGQLSIEQLYLQANRAGMNIADYTAGLRTPEGQMARAQTVDVNVGRLVQNQLGQEAVNEIGARIAAQDPEGRGANIDTNDPFWAELAADIQRKYNINPDMMQRVLGRVGGVQGLDISNSVEYAVKAAAGKTSQVSAMREDQARTAQRRVDPASLRMPVGAGAGVAAPASQELRDVAESVGYRGDLGRLGRQWNPFGRNEINVENMRRQYIRGIQDTGERNPVVERLLGQVSEASKIQVRTAGGERVVSVEDALRHFQDQLQSGEAMIAAGPGEGRSVGEFVGAADQRVKVTSAQDKALGKIGQSMEDFRRREGGEGGGKVLIAPTPELARWLSFSTSGRAVLDSSRLAGVPPVAFPAPESLTGG